MNMYLACICSLVAVVYSLLSLLIYSDLNNLCTIIFYYVFEYIFILSIHLSLFFIKYKDFTLDIARCNS